MQIGFITTHLGVFGSIRELVENANELQALGHEVTIYNKTHVKVSWLPCHVPVVKSIKDLPSMDALIMMDSPFNDIFAAWNKCKAKFKTFVMMGFNHETGIMMDNLGPKPTSTERNLRFIFENHVVCADGQWQIDYFREHGIDAGVSIGGINLRMFRRLNIERNINVGHSGDSRPRKADVIIQRALKSIKNKDTYYGKGDQEYIVNFLNRCVVFADNHARAGWCNPVLEALACGCAVVCSKIPANSEFAIHNHTAIVLEENTPEKFTENIMKLLRSSKLRERLTGNAEAWIERFDYPKVAKNFANFLESKI